MGRAFLYHSHMHNLDRPCIYTNPASLPVGTKKIDALGDAWRELFFIEHPNIPKDHPQIEGTLAAYLRKKRGVAGVWAYYPWRKAAVHIPNEATYLVLRTARNRNLISREEQLRYRRTVIGIAGLSVGSTALAAIVATGGAKRLKIADPDTIEITNLNRMRALLTDVGAKKALVAAHLAYELDPFADIETWAEGISVDTIGQFVRSPRLSMFIDEMDAIPLKIQARIECKRAKVPVLMATDNGDGAIMDVERFDLEPDRPIFHGRVHIHLEDLATIGRDRFVALANEIIDPKYFTPRQQESILAIGKTVAGVPQLATAATIAGAAIAYAARRIATGAPLPSGRYVIGCEPSLEPDFHSAHARRVRAAGTREFIKIFAARAKR